MIPTGLNDRLTPVVLRLGSFNIRGQGQALSPTIFFASGPPSPLTSDWSVRQRTRIAEGSGERQLIRSPHAQSFPRSQPAPFNWLTTHPRDYNLLARLSHQLSSRSPPGHLVARLDADAGSAFFGMALDGPCCARAGQRVRFKYRGRPFAQRSNGGGIRRCSGPLVRNAG